MIFVTGGTGLLGMRIVYDLLVKGESLRLIRRKNSDMGLFSKVLEFYHGSDPMVLIDSIDWVEGDVLDPLFIETCLVGCSHCIHAAAMVSFHQKDYDRMRAINIQGTANIVNACLQVEGIRLLFISSVASLGRTSDSRVINEKAMWKDSPFNSGYAISKYHSEMEVWRGIEEGLSAVIINPSIVLGAGAKDRSSGTIFGVVSSGLKFYTDGGASVVDARDVSKVGIRLLMGSLTGQRFVVCATTIPYKDLFTGIAQRIGIKAPSIHIGARLLGLAWRLTWIKDMIFGSRSAVTRETTLSASTSYQYDSQKIKEITAMDFHSVDDSLDFYSPFYAHTY